MKAKAEKKGTTRDLSLEKKLALYGLAGSALLALPAAARADIIYSGLLNKTVSYAAGATEASGYNSSDFELKVSDASFLFSYLFSTGTDSAGALIVDQYLLGLLSSSNSMIAVAADDYATAFSANDVIEESTSWLSAGSKAYLVAYENGVNQGNWSTDGSTAYVGLAFIVDDVTYYGWVRVGSTYSGSTASFTFYDWAYNDEAGESILAGDTGTTSAVPEPTTLSLFALGAMGLGMLRRIRKLDSSEA